MSDPRRDNVRGRILFGREHSAISPRDMPPNESTDKIVDDQSSTSALVPPKRPAAVKPSRHFAPCELSAQNPRQIYKPWTSIFHEKLMILVQTMDDCAHRSIRRLLKILQHGSHFVSKYRITERDLTLIVWPVSIHIHRGGPPVPALGQCKSSIKGIPGVAHYKL
ncbi:hypothetical protein BDV59DRAFT_202229 [Aspergillus ambiguus]|uniref:uncharacterized protein n=1 Tax=Aspergillus ambiguus TaxID=176160 RepID=UPI003CCDDD6E